jgi:Tol biopolymer transport system component
MTDRGRIEGRLPDLLAELAPARVPDYFDELCRAVERTPQRPAWRSLERWLPMGAIARPAPLGLPSWRPLILLGLLLLALVAGTMLVAGSSRRQLAPPFGLAANGPIVFATADGDILQVDPATGRTTDLVVGDAVDSAPWFSGDGSRLFFVRTEDGGDVLMVASTDGSGVREIVPAGQLGDDVETSPTGDRVAIAGNQQRSTVSLVNVPSGATAVLEFAGAVDAVTWRPEHDQLVLMGQPDGMHAGYWLAGTDGSNLAPLPTVGSVLNEPVFSPDGRSLVYTTWDDDGAGGQGLVHVLDVDQGQDRELARNPEYTRLNVVLSPDGTRILLERYDATDNYQVAILPIDGGPEVVLGDPHGQTTNGAALQWSPDGTQVLVTYRADGTTWLYPADGSTTGEQVPWPTTEMASWQRLAP